jgi:hypothetical protein
MELLLLKVILLMLRMLDIIQLVVIGIIKLTLMTEAKKLKTGLMKLLVTLRLTKKQILVYLLNEAGQTLTNTIITTKEIKASKHYSMNYMIMLISID